MADVARYQSNFLDESSHSPSGLAIVIGLHAFGPCARVAGEIGCSLAPRTWPAAARTAFHWSTNPSFASGRAAAPLSAESLASGTVRANVRSGCELRFPVA